MSSAWHHIDTHPLSAADRDTVLDAIEAGRTYARLLNAMPETLASIRDSMAGQPRAANPDAEHSTATAWCWVHERELTRCIAEGLPCSGDVIDRPTDPVGEAAVTADRAAGHHRDALRFMRTITERITELDTLAALYPTEATTRDTTDDPGQRPDNACTNCWTHGATKDIDRRGDGTAYYTGRCKKCGEFRSIHGFDRPHEFIDYEKRGIRPTPGMVDLAVKAHRTKAKKGKKTKIKSNR